MGSCEAILSTSGKKCTCKSKPNLSVCGRHTKFVECPICYAYFSSTQLIYLPCDHSFCVSCIRMWLKSKMTCPCCRGPSSKIPEQLSNCIALFATYLPDSNERIMVVDKICSILNTNEGGLFLEFHPKFKNVFIERLKHFKQDFIRLHLKFTPALKVAINKHSNHM